MNRKTLISLLALAALLVLAASLTNLSERLGGNFNQMLLPELEAQLNSLTSIRVIGGGNQTIASLSRGENAWKLADKFGYRADIGRIRSNLLALARAKIVEQKTAKPEYFERLGVEDVAGEAAKGVLIELESLDKPVKIIIGDTDVGGGDYAYARKADENQSWLISGAFDLPTDTLAWLDREILDIPTARIRAVTITHSDGEVLRIEKAAAENPNFEVQGIPDDRELNYPSVANAIAGVLTGLRLEDVRTNVELDSEKVTPSRIVFETFDGLRIDLTVYSLTDNTWTLVSARVGELSIPATPENSNGAENQPDIKKPAIDDEVEKLNARLGGWAYTLASYKSEQLLKRIDELLAPVDSDGPLPEKIN